MRKQGCQPFKVPPLSLRSTIGYKQSNKTTPSQKSCKAKEKRVIKTYMGTRLQLDNSQQQFKQINGASKIQSSREKHSNISVEN